MRTGVRAGAGEDARGGRSSMRRQPGGVQVNRVPIAVAAGCASVWLGLATGAVRWNSDRSLPRGIYLAEHRSPAPLDLVLVCPPSTFAAFALSRHYLRAGPCPGGVKPLGKIVLGSAGDLVELSAEGLSLNGRLVAGSKPQPGDAKGRPLPHYPFGRYRIERERLWVFTPHPRSLDSRYFGPVASAAVEAVLSPFWISSADPKEWIAAEGERVGGASSF
jgi:conjugative transfer signal peptidase TraF